MQEIKTPLLGSDLVCPGCGLFHHHSDCGYRDLFPDNPELSPDGLREGPRGFSRRGEYCGLGQERNLCGSRVVLLTCSKYLHDYAKRLYCGREWCYRCGLDESDSHKRRYARQMDKVFYLGDAGKNHGLGYFVFTIPSQIREQFKSKTRLQDAGKAVRNILKKHGFDVGLSRWHFFGDGGITEGELDLSVYHPHINGLVVGRWLYEEEMKAIKEEWREYLENVSGESIDVVDVWYQYFKSQSQWWHKAVYVTRSTFKELSGNEQLAERLFGFRNVVSWGFGQKRKREEKLIRGRVVLSLWLDDMKAKEQEEIMTRKEFDKLILMSHMKCVECMEQGLGLVGIITYQDFNGCRKVVDMEDLLPRIKRELSGGFYLLHPIILNKKPMSEEVEEKEEVYEEYDTS